MTDENVRLSENITAYPISNSKCTTWVVKDNDGQYVAFLEWNAFWQEYMMHAVSEGTPSPDCLIAIAGFCQKLTKQACPILENSPVSHDYIKNSSYFKEEEEEKKKEEE